jgi:hypothetical protein
MRFSIHTGNHGSHNGLSDTVTFLKCALQDCGHDARIDTELASSRVNIVLEHFPDAAAVERIAQARAAGARFVVVATEPMIGGTFNAGIAAGHSHYGNTAYWKQRYSGFVAAAAHAEAVWVLAESMVAPYQAALPGTPVLFLPHGWVSDFARMRHRAEADKDIDFYSSGTLTDHRMKVFRALGERGHRVVWDPLGVPDYLRFEHLSRAKVCMSLKLSATSEVPSVSRLHFLLEHACAIAHERCAQTSPLDPYLLHLPGDALIEWCEAMLALPDRREIAEGAATRFATELPMSRLLPPILSASLNGRVRHAVTA